MPLPNSTALLLVPPLQWWWIMLPYNISNRQKPPTINSPGGPSGYQHMILKSNTALANTMVTWMAFPEQHKSLPLLQISPLIRWLLPNLFHQHFPRLLQTIQTRLNPSLYSPYMTPSSPPLIIFLPAPAKCSWSLPRVLRVLSLYQHRHNP